MSRLIFINCLYEAFERLCSSQILTKNLLNRNENPDAEVRRRKEGRGSSRLNTNKICFQLFEMIKGGRGHFRKLIVHRFNKINKKRCLSWSSFYLFKTKKNTLALEILAKFYALLLIYFVCPITRKKCVDAIRFRVLLLKIKNKLKFKKITA